MLEGTLYTYTPLVIYIPNEVQLKKPKWINALFIKLTRNIFYIQTPDSVYSNHHAHIAKTVINFLVYELFIEQKHPKQTSKQINRQTYIK